MLFCPEEFASNCRNCEVKCHLCSGNKQGRYKLLYSPVIKQEGLRYKDHPVYIDKAKIDKDLAKAKKLAKKSSPQAIYSAKGRKAERKNIQKLIKDTPGIEVKHTARSGALYHDGDALIKLPDGSKISVEHKLRITRNNISGPTSKEWEESSDSIFIIASKERGKVVAMSYESFLRILSCIEGYE
jgi:hypothetical protein